MIRGTPVRSDAPALYSRLSPTHLCSCDVSGIKPSDRINFSTSGTSDVSPNPHRKVPHVAAAPRDVPSDAGKAPPDGVINVQKSCLRGKPNDAVTVLQLRDTYHGVRDSSHIRTETGHRALD